MSDMIRPRSLCLVMSAFVCMLADDSLDLDSLGEPLEFLHDRPGDHRSSNRQAGGELSNALAHGHGQCC